MRTMRFTITVSEGGTILLPLGEQMTGKDVEVLVTAKAQKKTAKGKARAFAEKWAGCITTADDDVRYEHLMRKHR